MTGRSNDRWDESIVAEAFDGCPVPPLPKTMVRVAPPAELTRSLITRFTVAQKYKPSTPAYTLTRLLH